VKATKPNCLLWTVVFLTLAGASGWFVYRRMPTGMAAIVGGIFGGVILLIGLSWFGAIPARIVEWWLIVRARFGGEPRDGKRTAIIGMLRGHGELEAPFSRERCVLYSYEIVTRDVVDGQSSERKAYEGFAMVPLSIEHGVERTRILARPEVPGLPADRPASRAAEANARQFVEKTGFEKVPIAAKDEPDLTRGDGHLRYDYSREPIETNIGACRLEEKVLRPDLNACVLGEYKADRHALIAPVTIRTGTAFAIAAAWRVVNAAIATAIFAAIALIVLAVFCANYPIDAAEQAHPEWTLGWWEIDLERFVDRNVRLPLARAGMRTSTGYRLQEVCEGCAKGRLEIDGRTIELKHAAYQGGRSVHLSPKPGDRDGVTLDGRDHVVLTVNGKSADVPPSWLQENDVETSLGQHGEYAGRVTVIAPDRSIRCRVTFNTRVDPDAWLPSRTPPPR